MGAVDHNATRTIRDLRARIAELERERSELCEKIATLVDDGNRLEAERDALLKPVRAICDWIDLWENRCLATDGDVPKTLEHAGESGRDELDKLLGKLYRAAR